MGRKLCYSKNILFPPQMFFTKKSKKKLFEKIICQIFDKKISKNCQNFPKNLLKIAKQMTVRNGERNFDVFFSLFSLFRFPNTVKPRFLSTLQRIQNLLFVPSVINNTNFVRMFYTEFDLF